MNLRKILGEDSEEPDHDIDSDYDDKPEQVARDEKREQKDAAAADDAESEEKTEIYILADRWNEDEYRALIATEPWTEMFEARPKELYDYKREDLSVDTKHQLDKYVAFMEENARALWEILHWLIMKTRGKTAKEADSLAGSQQLYKRRCYRHVNWL
ncbi:unnamed protein product [Phytophthora lilii]|uniref:Unnamed protein product n=1 Tax=Phytophthora lilii TaxID=2077276 RepID=A0A9W6XFT8_9STRA|nr:unnamed protein product [Phytophthora lilii]